MASFHSSKGLHFDVKAKQLAEPFFGVGLELRDLLLYIHAFLPGSDLVAMLHFSYEKTNWSHGSSMSI